MKALSLLLALTLQISCAGSRRSEIIGGWTVDLKKTPLVTEDGSTKPWPKGPQLKLLENGRFDFIVGTMTGKYELKGDKVEFIILEDTLKWDEVLSLSRISGKKGMFYMKWQPSQNRLYWTIKNKHMRKPYEICLKRED